MEMESVFNKIGLKDEDAKDKVKLYISSKHIPQLFESIMIGLLYHRPEHPVEFVRRCFQSPRLQQDESNPTPVKWNAFIDCSWMESDGKSDEVSPTQATNVSCPQQG